MFGQETFSLTISIYLIQPGSEDYPQNALHIFAENANANIHKDKMLDSNENNLFSEKAIDNLPQHIAQDKIEKLFKKIKVKLGDLRQPSTLN